MKKFIFVVILALCMCLMQGCMSKQLNERMVIQGMGIDYGEGEYRVTVMYMNTEEGDSGQSHKTAEGKGRTITDAVAGIISQNGLDPLYSHNSFILLGKGICREGVGEALEFFSGYYQCRPSVNVLVSENDANEIMTLKDVTPHTIADIASSKNTSDKTLSMPMYIFMADILNEKTTACTSVIAEDNGVVHSEGIALFKDDRLIKRLNSEEAVGVMLMRGSQNITAEVIPLEGKSKSFALSQESTKISVKVDKGILYCDILIKGEASVYEYTNSGRAVKEKIEERLNKIADNGISACSESGADVFYLCKRLRQSDYEMYKNIDNWDSLIKNGVYTVHSDIAV